MRRQQQVLGLLLAGAVMGQLMITVQPKAPRAEITITSGAVTHTVYVDSQGSVIPGVPGGVPGPTTVSGGASSIDTGVSTAPTGVLTPTLTSSVLGDTSTAPTTVPRTLTPAPAPTMANSGTESRVSDGSMVGLVAFCVIGLILA